jgi:hypothetical protein
MPLRSPMGSPGGRSSVSSSWSLGSPAAAMDMVMRGLHKNGRVSLSVGATDGVERSDEWNLHCE